MLTSVVCAFGDVLTLAVSSRLCKDGPPRIPCHGVPRPSSAALCLGHVCDHFAELSPEFILVISLLVLYDPALTSALLYKGVKLMPIFSLPSFLLKSEVFNLILTLVGKIALWISVLAG